MRYGAGMWLTSFRGRKWKRGRSILRKEEGARVSRTSTAGEHSGSTEGHLEGTCDHMYDGDDPNTHEEGRVHAEKRHADASYARSASRTTVPGPSVPIRG